MSTDALIEVRALFLRKGDKTCAEWLGNDWILFDPKNWEDALEDIVKTPPREPHESDQDRWCLEGLSERDLDVVVTRDLIAFNFHCIYEGRCDTKYGSGIEWILEGIGWAEMMEASRDDLVRDANAMYAAVTARRPAETFGELAAQVNNEESREPIEVRWIGAMEYQSEGGGGGFYDDSFEDWAVYLGRVRLSTIVAMLQPGEPPQQQAHALPVAFRSR